jgi:hypothetical protein
MQHGWRLPVCVPEPMGFKQSRACPRSAFDRWRKRAAALTSTLGAIPCAVCGYGPTCPRLSMNTLGRHGTKNPAFCGVFGEEQDFTERP